MNKIEQNLMISREVGLYRSKGFKPVYDPTGTNLIRVDCVIKYRHNAWRVYEVIDGVVQNRSISKHPNLYAALRSVH